MMTPDTCIFCSRLIESHTKEEALECAYSICNEVGKQCQEFEEFLKNLTYFNMYLTATPYSIEVTKKCFEVT